MESSALLDAARSYVVAVLDFLNKNCPPSAVNFSSGSADGSAKETPSSSATWWNPTGCDASGLTRTKLHCLKEHGAFVIALRRDPEIGPQLEQMVGHEFVLTKLTTEKVTDRLVWQVAQRSDHLEFSEEVFVDEYLRFDLDLRRKEYEIIIVAPLLGLSIASPPIALEESLEVDSLSDNEIAYCLEAGLLPSPPMSYGVAPITELFGVRIRYAVPKREVSLSPSDVQPAFDRLNEAVRLADQVLHALRISPCRVPPENLVRSDGASELCYSNAP